MSVGRILRRHGSYGEDELNRILQLVSPSSHVIVLGAHIGAIAIPIAKRVETCILIEANPNTFDLLKANLFINNALNAECHNVAVGEKKGEINFLQNTLNSGGSKREPVVRSGMYYHDKPEKIRVPMTTLDKLCENKTKKVDLLFMDIEGSEIFALRGGNATLSRTQALIIEFIPHHITDVADCSIDDFVKPLEDHFNYCFIPSKNLYIEQSDFLRTFATMQKNGDNDDGVIFTKSFVKFND